MSHPLQQDRRHSFSAPILSALRPAMEEALATLGNAPQVEQALLLQQLFADQSKALTHLYLGERAIGEIPGVPSETHILALGSAAVVGAGTMDSHRQFGELWRPAPLLERLAPAGGSFYPHANQAAG